MSWFEDEFENADKTPQKKSSRKKKEVHSPKKVSKKATPKKTVTKEQPSLADVPTEHQVRANQLDGLLDSKPPVGVVPLKINSITEKYSTGIITAVRGKAKTGKTSFGLSASLMTEPIGFLPPIDTLYWIDTHMGLERALWRYEELIEEKRIKIYDIYAEKEDEDFGEMIDPIAFVEKMDASIHEICGLMQKNPKSILIMDDWTDYQGALTDIVRLREEVSRDENVAPKKMRMRNLKMESMIKKMKRFGSAILIGKDKEKWASASEKSGNWIPAWSDKIPYWVDSVGMTEFDPMEGRSFTILESGFGLEADDKTGVPAIDPVIKEPTYPKFLTLFQPRLEKLKNLRSIRIKRK